MLLLCGHRRPVSALAFRPDGRTLASADGRGREVWLWDLGSPGEPRARLRQMELDSRLTDLAFSPDGELLATVDPYSRVQLWRMTADSPEEAGLLDTYYGHPAGACEARLAFSPDGRTLAVSGATRPGPPSKPVVYGGSTYQGHWACG